MAETCTNCQGHGDDDEKSVADCPDCDGTGAIPPQYADEPRRADGE